MNGIHAVNNQLPPPLPPPANIPANVTFTVQVDGLQLFTVAVVTPNGGTYNQLWTNITASHDFFTVTINNDITNHILFIDGQTISPIVLANLHGLVNNQSMAILSPFATIPDGQYPSVISSDLGSEFNSKDFYNWLEDKRIRLFYINKSDYKTSYAAAIADRFIRTIKEKLERYQKLNDTKSIIQAVKDIVEGYNNTTHRMLGKSPNEMIRADVEKNTAEKREHNNEVMHKVSEDLQNKTVGILNRKNVSDKGSKMKLGRDSHNVTGSEGYNIKLDNERTYPPKDIVVLKDKS